MKLRVVPIICLVALALCLNCSRGLALAAAAGGPAIVATNPSGVITVLNENSPWRKFHVRRTPTICGADGKQQQANVSWYGQSLSIKHFGPKDAPYSSPLPPANWAGADFDDIGWSRPSAMPMIAELWARPGQYIDYEDGLLAFRGKFQVQNPAQVKDLEVSLSYYGGAVVYINGAEVARGQLPGNKPDLEQLAEAYPDELLLLPDGARFDGRIPPAKHAEILAKRERKLSGVKIPATLLRQGVNVLAIEIHAAPVSEALVKASDQYHGWPPIGLQSIRLTISSPGSVTPNTGAVAGFQLWTDRIYETSTTAALGDPCEPFKQITVAAARNGVFSGRFYVRSDQAIRNLKVTVSDLAAAGGLGMIPASAVRVRCAAPAAPDNSYVKGNRFDALLDEIPAEIAVAKNSGAVAPIWLTLRTPPDAKPGNYAGTVSVAADGLPPVTVQFKAAVAGWSVPDPKDFRVHIFGQMSPDSLVKRYNVPRWGEKHLELIAKSMSLMAQINSRQALVDMTINFYGGNKGSVDCSNEDSMVRWIKQADGSYTYDFSIFDKYLAMVDKIIGKPLPLRLNCWKEWRLMKMDKGAGADNYKVWFPNGCQVSLLDPATGKLGTLDSPSPDKPEFVAFWKPVLDEMRKKIEARGWFDVTAVGTNSYCFGVDPQLADGYQKIWPDGVWYYTAHNGTQPSAFSTLDKTVKMPVRYADCVWTAPPVAVRGYTRLLNAKWAGSYWGFTFRGTRDWDEIATIRDIPYREILMGLNAWGDFGVDFFPVKGENGRFYTVGNGRGTGGPDDGVTSLLAPGPTGALATERYEMVREGLQVAEAVLFLQKAIEDKKLTGDLEKTVNAYLDSRDGFGVRGAMAIIDRQEWDGKLLNLASEAAGAMSK